jgi:citrate lyase subunit beta/citryl-CoA lyase
VFLEEIIKNFFKMESKIVSSASGKRGDNIRSDCYFQIKSKKSGGIKTIINNNTVSIYNEANRKLINDMCHFFALKNAEILFEDSGALPFVIAARFESAINKLYPQNQKEFLLPFNKRNLYSSSKNCLRRSRLYLPGNEPKFFINAGLHKPDGIILDLEDSVSYSEKHSAQLLVRNALRSVDFYGAERMIRINQLPAGLKDLKYIVPNNVHVILIPKCETAQQVIDVETEVIRIKKESNIRNEIYYMPIIESALGTINSYEIATASPNICALAIGLEDYTADIGVQRTSEGRESLFARSMVINAAKAASIQAVDSVYSDIEDMEGLRESILEAKSLGFEGKGCIHPRQIAIVHENFAPTPDELERAQEIVSAYEEAEKQGLGVVSLRSKMIDAPVVKRAQRTIELAELMN